VKATFTSTAAEIIRTAVVRAEKVMPQGSGWALTTR
jgi:hypothetical protein